MLDPIVEQRFLDAILSRYSSLTPRLIFADFLAESRDPADVDRSEFIRIQCALDRLSPQHPRRSQLVFRESELLHKHRFEWTRSLQGIVPPDGCEFRRGILDAVAIETGVFLKIGPALFQQAPIRRVRFLDPVPHLTQLIACPSLASVQEIDLCNGDLGNGGLNHLLRSPYLQRLKLLDLGSNGITDRGMEFVARSFAMPELRELDLQMNGAITSLGLKHLADSPNYAKLQFLDLSWNEITTPGVSALAASRYFPRLHTVRLIQNPIGDGGTSHWVESKLFARATRRTRRLDLRQTGIGPAGAKAIADSAVSEGLRSLNLSGNPLGDAGLIALAESEHLPRLRELHLRQTRLTDQAALMLAQSPLMSKLRFLDVSSNQLTSKGVDALWNARGNWDAEIDWSDNLTSAEYE